MIIMRNCKGRFFNMILASSVLIRHDTRFFQYKRQTFVKNQSNHHFPRRIHNYHFTNLHLTRNMNKKFRIRSTTSRTNHRQGTYILRGRISTGFGTVITSMGIFHGLSRFIRLIPKLTTTKANEGVENKAKRNFSNEREGNKKGKSNLNFFLITLIVEIVHRGFVRRTMNRNFLNDRMIITIDVLFGLLFHFANVFNRGTIRTFFRIRRRTSNTFRV